MSEDTFSDFATHIGKPGDITKTRLYRFDPLKPQFYMVKLVFTGVYITEAVLMSTHNLCFEQKSENYQNLSSESFHFFGGKILNIFE